MMPNRLAGLRIVLHECDRRAAVLRCLTSVRWLSLRGAEALLVDGVSDARRSVDRTPDLVSRRFPWVRVVPKTQDMLPRWTAPLTVGASAPRWILSISADLEVERWAVEALLVELEASPAGTILLPGLVGPDGAELEGPPLAWLARAADVTLATAKSRQSATSLVVPRPEACRDHRARPCGGAGFERRGPFGRLQHAGA